MSEDQIIQSIAEGNIWALEQLYNLTNKRVYAYILSMVKNRHISEDLVHDTYLRIFEKAKSYQCGTSLNTWIMTIAKNITFDYFRKAKYAMPFDEGPIEDSKSNQLDICDTIADCLDIEKALLELSETDVQIAILYAVCGYKHHEIAHILSIPAGTVRRRYRKAIKQLADSLGGVIDG